MSPVRVKFCGITRAEDARTAAALGADAIGLVFYAGSPRAVTLPQAMAVVSGLPPFVARVGLFVDPRMEEVEMVLQLGGVDVLQFHGAEPPEFCRHFGRPYIKALRMRPGMNVRAEVERHPDAAAVLLDTHEAGKPGGTGRAFDWTLIPRDLPRPVILAGGLTPDNVAAAIRQAQPYAVDVSGGIESAPGVKDAGLMQAFLHEVKTCCESNEPSTAPNPQRP
ncbi:MAG TPA: phosphoribosylanthranilate isomerase [Gammaproteobacteria bacterium]|nr:phosphoribosylanthranilate isomerase [Gammaproteobacteria bacterium]